MISLISINGVECYIDKTKLDPSKVLEGTCKQNLNISNINGTKSKPSKSSWKYF